LLAICVNLIQQGQAPGPAARAERDPPTLSWPGKPTRRDKTKPPPGRKKEAAGTVLACPGVPPAQGVKRRPGK